MGWYTDAIGDVPWSEIAEKIMPYLAGLTNQTLGSGTAGSGFDSDGNLIAKKGSFGGVVSSFVSNGGKIRRTGSAQSINDATYTAAVFDTEDYDGNAYGDIATYNTRLTVPATGLYLLNARVSFASNAVGVRGLYLRVLGTTYVGGTNQAAINGDRTVLNLCILQNLLAAEYVEVMLYQNSGAALNAENLDHRSITLSAARLL